MKCLLCVSLTALSLVMLGCVFPTPKEMVSISISGNDWAAVNTTYPSGFRVTVKNEGNPLKMQLQIHLPEYVRLDATFLNPGVQEERGNKTQGNTYSLIYDLDEDEVVQFVFDYITLDWQDTDIGSYTYGMGIQASNLEGEIIGSNLTAQWTVWKSWV